MNSSIIVKYLKKGKICRKIHYKEIKTSQIHKNPSQVMEPSVYKEELNNNKQIL